MRSGIPISGSDEWPQPTAVLPQGRTSLVADETLQLCDKWNLRQKDKVFSPALADETLQPCDNWILSDDKKRMILLVFVSHGNVAAERVEGEARRTLHSLHNRRILERSINK